MQTQVLHPYYPQILALAATENVLFLSLSRVDLVDQLESLGHPARKPPRQPAIESTRASCFQTINTQFLGFLPLCDIASAWAT